MNTPETNINTITVAPMARLTTVCSIDQIHQTLSLAVRDERRIEATISEIRDRDGMMWLGMTQAMADTRSARSLSGRVDRSARQALDDAAGGLFGKHHLGSTIVADVRLGLANDGRIKATVIDVLQICASPFQRSARTTLQALQADGLLAIQRHLPGPTSIRAVAVICPPTSAGQVDVAYTLGRMFGSWEIEIRWIPVPFEGQGAEAAIGAALEVAAYMAGRNEISAILIVRGGGSPGALAYLDSECLARKVAAMRVPVVTGLGHADNRTLLDEVAHYAASTPTDAARWVVRARALIERAKPAPEIVTEAEQPLGGPPAADLVSLALCSRDCEERPPVASAELMRAASPLSKEPHSRADVLQNVDLRQWPAPSIVDAPAILPTITAAETGVAIETAVQARVAGRMAIEFGDGAVMVRTADPS